MTLFLHQPQMVTEILDTTFSWNARLIRILHPPFHINRKCGCVLFSSFRCSGAPFTGTLPHSFPRPLPPSVEGREAGASAPTVEEPGRRVGRMHLARNKNIFIVMINDFPTRVLGFRSRSGLRFFCRRRCGPVYGLRGFFRRGSRLRR